MQSVCLSRLLGNLLSHKQSANQAAGVSLKPTATESHAPVPKQVQALVPLKDLVAAKTRLSGLLRPTERRALAQAMAEDVLSVLCGHPDIARVTLVSDDPSAAMLAQRYGARHWSESSLAAHGLNPVIAAASRRILADVDAPLLVLHADLPLLTAADVAAIVAAQQQQRGLVIGCDQRRSGTNLLAFDAQSVPEFAFGEQSCDAHERWAVVAGVPVDVVLRPGIALDVDDPEDLQVLMTSIAEGWDRQTQRLLRDTPLGRRLSVALDAREGLEQAAANAEASVEASAEASGEANIDESSTGVSRTGAVDHMQRSAPQTLKGAR